MVNLYRRPYCDRPSLATGYHQQVGGSSDWLVERAVYEG